MKQPYHEIYNFGDRATMQDCLIDNITRELIVLNEHMKSISKSLIFLCNVQNGDQESE